MSFENHVNYDLFIKDPSSFLQEFKDLNIKHISISKSQDFLNIQKPFMLSDSIINLFSKCEIQYSKKINITFKDNSNFSKLGNLCTKQTQSILNLQDCVSVSPTCQKSFEYILNSFQNYDTIIFDSGLQHNHSYLPFKLTHKIFNDLIQKHKQFEINQQIMIKDTLNVANWSSIMDVVITQCRTKNLIISGGQLDNYSIKSKDELKCILKCFWNIDFKVSDLFFTINVENMLKANRQRKSDHTGQVVVETNLIENENQKEFVKKLEGSEMKD